MKVKLSLKDADIGGYRVNAEIEAAVVDMGIGAYEFWGQKGFHSQMGLEEILILKAEYAPEQEDLPEQTAEEWLDLDSNTDQLYSVAEDAWAEQRRDERDPDNYPEEE